MGFDQQTELFIFEALEEDPETTQADVAAKVGVAVGTVNWYLKRWTAKGYVKAKKIGRWQWSYILTPQGLAEKARLAGKYVDASMRIYRQTRLASRELLGQIIDNGYESVFIVGDDDIADICRLTCLELGVKSIKNQRPDQPTIQIEGMTLVLKMPEPTAEKDSS